ncbi:DUF3789 domain-containing protein [Klebsiella aerogenes]|uniref:DUF3789 domain-containing protein n=1 Tax=Klebsiella aerogenes TaxID=548 RepID=UPI0009BACA62
MIPWCGITSLPINEMITESHGGSRTEYYLYLHGDIMTFISGIVIGLFIGAWIGILTMCLCRISAS